METLTVCAQLLHVYQLLCNGFQTYFYINLLSTIYNDIWGIMLRLGSRLGHGKPYYAFIE